MDCLAVVVERKIMPLFARDCQQMVASRVAEEMRVQLGAEVGYSIRFEDLTRSVSLVSSTFCKMIIFFVITDWHILISL